MKVEMEGLIAKLGQPGKFQVVVFLLLCLNYFPLVFNTVVMAFYGMKPEHTCHSRSVYSVESTTVTSSLNGSGIGAGSLKVEYGACESKYNVPGHGNLSVTCPHEDSMLVYNKPEKLSTIVTEWDLVCGEAFLGPLTTTIYFVGVMVGGLVFGHLADKFGRKPVMLVCLLLPVVVGVAMAFVPWFSVFITLRFFQGVLMQGLQTSTYTLAMELFLPRHRSYVGAILEVFWGCAVMMIPLLAYLLPNWRHLQLTITLPSLAAFFYICFMPESLRWLILKNKVEQARNLMQRIVDWNRADFPQEAWDNVKLDLDHRPPDNKHYSALDLVRTPKLRKRTIVLFYLWFAISVAYYGLTWQLTSLPGNKYLNFFIAGAVETVAYALVIPTTLRFGRKRPLMFYFLLASVFLAGAGLVPLVTGSVHAPVIASGLAIAGKFAMGGLFCMIFLYTSELYPTIIRNIGMGSCAFFTRLGGVVAPQIVTLREISGVYVPMFICAGLMVLGGGLSILLPETVGRRLPDHIEDVEVDKLRKEERQTAENTHELETLTDKPHA